MSRLEIRGCYVTHAQDFVARHHRHAGRPTGGLFATSAWLDGVMVGVALAGRPPPEMEGKSIVDVTRCCLTSAPEHFVASRLYGAITGAALRLGWRRLLTYTRVDEPGTSLRAANWRPTARVKGRPHNTGNRAFRWLPGLDAAPYEVIDRIRWEHGPDAEPEDQQLASRGRRRKPTKWDMAPRDERCTCVGEPIVYRDPACITHNEHPDDGGDGPWSGCWGHPNGAPR